MTETSAKPAPISPGTESGSSTRTEQSPGEPLKDLCEHIRTVHLTILGVCLLLLGVLIRDQPRPLSTAIADVKAMSSLAAKKAEIDSALQAYAQSVVENYAHNSSQKLQSGRPAYILGEWLDGTKASYRLDYPVAWVVWGPFQRGESSYVADTPQQFRDFWNGSLSARILPTASFETATEISFTDLLTRRPGNGGKVLVLASTLDSFQKGILQKTFSKSTESQLLNPLPLPLHSEDSENNRLSSEWINHSKLVTVRLPELTVNADLLAAFLKATGMEDRWKHAPFEQSFGELSTQMATISGMTFKDTKDYLERQSSITAPEDTVDVFGAKLPTAKISNWGILIVLGIELYLLILLQQLSRQVQNSKSNTMIWVGLFPSQIARTFTLVSCAVLPIAVLLYLELKKWPNDTILEISYPVSMLLSLILSSCIVLQLRRVWDRVG